MGRKLKKPGNDAFDKHTEACPKMTRRWVRTAVPEIAAWLTVMRDRLSKAFDAAERCAQQYQTDTAMQQCSNLYTRIKYTDELIANLMDKWSDYSWWDAAKRVQEALSDTGELKPGNPTIPGMGVAVTPISREVKRAT